MSSTDQNKSSGKSGRRNRKAEPRNKKPDRTQASKADQRESLTSDELLLSERDQSLSRKSDPQSSENDRLPSAEPDQELSPERDQPHNQDPGQLLSAEPDQLEPPDAGQQQNREPGQLVSPEPDQQLSTAQDASQNTQADQGHDDADERIDAAIASAEIGAAAGTETARVNFQTIANAYGDYTRKSLEQTRSFVEKLAGVRSLDKIMEVQAEFAKQSYENFVTGSQRICELHSELARQTFKPWQGPAAH